MATITTIANGFRHLSYDQLDSTNAECARLAANGDQGNLWVTAKSQTSGKGRRGREWVSNEGNLFASLLLINPSSQGNLVTLPFVASLAVARAINLCNGSKIPELTIKWPNDVLISGKKISGILLESTHLANDRLAVVIGIGINCSEAPDNTLFPVTSFMEEGVDIDPATLFEFLHSSMYSTLKKWDKGQGFVHIRQAWLDLASGIGQPIIARFDDHQQNGIFVDIDQQGYLLLKTREGIKTISAADIFFQNDKKEAMTQS